MCNVIMRLFIITYPEYLTHGFLCLCNRYDYDRFSDFFNWTMTYRSDSDIPRPYGRLIPKSREFSYSPNASEEGQWEHVYNPAQGSQLSDINTKNYILIICVIYKI